MSFCDIFCSCKLFPVTLRVDNNLLGLRNYLIDEFHELMWLSNSHFMNKEEPYKLYIFIVRLIVV